MTFSEDRVNMIAKRFPSVSVLLRFTIFCVGIHSILLGLTIYFFTVPFFELMFSTAPDSPFYLKQSGAFLFILGFYYLFPARDMRRNRPLIALLVFSKVIAVAFLLGNAHMTPAPQMICLAALGDGLMATAVTFLMFLCYKNGASPFCPMANEK
jgi:hypothetical protein